MVSLHSGEAPGLKRSFGCVPRLESPQAYATAMDAAYLQCLEDRRPDVLLKEGKMSRTLGSVNLWLSLLAVPSCKPPCRESPAPLATAPVSQEHRAGVLGGLQREDGHCRGQTLARPLSCADVWPFEVRGKLRQKIEETGALPETAAWRHDASRSSRALLALLTT